MLQIGSKMFGLKECKDIKSWRLCQPTVHVQYKGGDYRCPWQAQTYQENDLPIYGVSKIPTLNNGESYQPFGAERKG